MDLPGHLEPIYSTKVYRDLLWKSRLSAEHKLVGTVISESCSYDKKNQVQVTGISAYSISRILNCTKETVESMLSDLIHYGWIFDTDRRIGARKVLVLTFSLIPMGEPKK